MAAYEFILVNSVLWVKLVKVDEAAVPEKLKNKLCFVQPY
jgi:hypothetical protein